MEWGFSSLFPYVGSKWAIAKRKKVTDGTAQHALGRIQTHLERDLKLKLRSPRNFFTTCAGQQLFPLEQREKLGRWAKGSVIPDRYGRALCATELRFRGDIIGRIEGGWRPQISFEPPPPTRRPREGSQ